MTGVYFQPFSTPRTRSTRVLPYRLFGRLCYLPSVAYPFWSRQIQDRNHMRPSQSLYSMSWSVSMG